MRKCMNALTVAVSAQFNRGPKAAAISLQKSTKQEIFRPPLAGARAVYFSTRPGHN